MINNSFSPLASKISCSEAQKIRQTMLVTFSRWKICSMNIEHVMLIAFRAFCCFIFLAFSWNVNDDHIKIVATNIRLYKSLGSVCNVKIKSDRLSEWVSDKVTYWAVLDSWKCKCHCILYKGINPIYIKCVKEHRCPYTWEMKMSLTNKLLNGVL